MKQMQTEHIKEIFKEITDDKIQSWEKVLFDNKQDSQILVDDDALLFNITLNQSNQRVIKNDCVRTRVKERVIQATFVEYSEKLLTYYCNQNKIKYKQGLNELIGPFVLLKFKCSLTFSRIYNMFVCFVDRHLTNYYNDDEFYSLQSSLSILTLLLKYHEPALNLLFENILITPEMYATSWILTGFANKMKLDIVYHIWDKIILFNDPILMHFLCLALLIYNKHKFIDVDCTQIPSILCQLVIENINQADDIIHLAFDLINKTPHSFRLLVDKLEIFHNKSLKTKELFQGFSIETMLSLPIFPSECLSILYPLDINCSNDKCCCYSSHFHQIINKQCKYCVDKKNLLYLFVDLRNKTIDDNISISEISSNEDIISSCGHLQGSIFPKQQGISDDDYENTIIDQIKEEVERRSANPQDDVHIVFITSRTDYFKHSNSKWYKEIIHEKEIIKKKKSTLLNFSTVNTTQSKRLESLIHIKEYYLLRHLMKTLQSNNWKYVSYIYGGYKEMHELALFYELPLVSHGQQCYWCSKANKANSLFSSLRTYFKKNNREINEGVKMSLSTEEIGSLIGDTSNAMFTCLMKEKGEEPSNMLLFINKQSIIMYKQKKTIINNNDRSTFLLLIHLFHSEVKDIKRDTAKGTEVLITFKANVKGYALMLKIDFITIEELNKFMIQRNKIIK